MTSLPPWSCLSSFLWPFYTVMTDFKFKPVKMINLILQNNTISHPEKPGTDFYF